MVFIKSVAVIGAGPAGCIAVDALAQEGVFDVIRVFERKDRAGGTWTQDPVGTKHQYPDLELLAARTPKDSIPIPTDLEKRTKRDDTYRFSESSIYEKLETNISAQAMAFSQEPFAQERTALNIQRHGIDSPFRHWKLVEKWVQGLLNRKGYENLVSYNTWVELVEKDVSTGKWIVTLRRSSKQEEYDTWWTEEFDAIVVANGHYFVPWIPAIPGLSDLEKNFPGTVEHSKAWRGPEKYTDKKVIVVGASISGSDISWSTAESAKKPLTSVTRGNYHPYFSEWAFQHPNIQVKPQIKHIKCNKETGERTVSFEDGTSVEGVDHIIFGTGYIWTLPFLPSVQIQNNRPQHIYQHVFWRHDPTLTFVGATHSGFTFKVFEWQAVLAARFLAGRIELPSIEEQVKWEQERIRHKGEGVAFAALNPDFEEYFETVRRLAGEPTKDGRGRRLLKFEKWWLDDFNAGHRVRIEMWKKGNQAARERIAEQERKLWRDDTGTRVTTIQQGKSETIPAVVSTLEVTDEIRLQA